MQRPALPALLLCVAILGLSAPPKSKRPASRTASSAAAKKAPASKKTAQSARKSPRTRTAAAGRKSKGTKATGRSRRRVASWRTGQQSPTPERYREIQQALIDKGYAAGPATGAWGPQWVSALKDFQGDQNLEPTGKLDALSLITLGLGPRREATATPYGLLTAPPPAASSFPGGATGSSARVPLSQETEERSYPER